MSNNRICLMVLSLMVFALSVASCAGEKENSGNAPAEMARIVGDKFVAGMNPDDGMAECLKYFKPMGNIKECDKNWFAGEKPHKVSVRTFSMDKYEVTQADFERVMGNNPSSFKGSDLPVESVTWFEAGEYCKKVGKRLPTEWEWEFAAKGGMNTMYTWGDTVESGKANFCDLNCEHGWKSSQFDDGYKNTSPVGSYPPNGYGLYDMAGNVWEWTESDYDNTGRKVLRGGSWVNSPSGTRSAERNNNVPGRRINIFGFRCSQ